MDSLLNIFVPEERKPKPQKAKKSPTYTVVKTSTKPGDVLKKCLEKNAKKPAKGSQKPKEPLKAAFIKSKKGNSGSSKPFLVSQKFKKSEVTGEEPTDNDEGFAVSFVKPKLFQKKPNMSKLEKSGTKRENHVKESTAIGRANTGEIEKFQKNATPLGQQPDGKSVGQKEDGGHLPSQEIVEFAGRPASQRGGLREKRKQGNADVFVAQTFSKWAINPSVTSEKVHVDFPTVGKTGSKSTLNKPTSKRKIALGEVDSSVKRKKRENSEENVGFAPKFSKTNTERKISSGANAGRSAKFESNPPNEFKKSGPISSLFNAAVEVEKLEDLDVEPVEERLFSRKQFSDIGVHPHLVGNMEQLFGITKMTVVQKKTIPVLMSGKDGLVRSQTGSGKTLAYAIPIMHSLAEVKPQLTRKDGVKALVVLPTRELALQTYECFTKLMRAFTWIVPGIVVGGEKRKSEKSRLRKGITVLVGTLGRLLDHAEHTDNLSLHGIDWLIIDEADKLLEMGYEKDISCLMSIIDGQREKSDSAGRKQTVLLSATLTSGVERLANLALTDPVRIDACGDSVLEDVLVIPNTLQQKYVVVPAKMRLVALASYLIDVAELKQSNKILVFMATQDMVDFYLELLQGVLSSTMKFYKLHGNMSQIDRTEVFNRFRSSDKGVLLSTDVAARGLDLPKVDWIVQFTAPTTPAEYVHRVGRTARVGTAGSALLFLLPSELHFVSMLNSSRIKLGEASLDQYLKSLMKIHLESKDGQRWGGGVEGAATVLQHNFEHSVLEDSALHEMAAKAYKSWVRFYATYPKDLRVVFDFKSLHLGHNAKSFALRDPPRAIGGIGKPKIGDKHPRGGGRARKDDRRKRKSEGLGHVTSSSRTKQLVLSEFDSGLKPLKKS